MRLAALALVLVLAGCATAPPPPPAPVGPPPKPAAPVAHHLADPDLQPIPPPRALLAIDWATARYATDADALALWQQIAPTGDDWDRKLDEIPTDKPVARALATALLRDGHFACTAPPAATHNCRPLPTDVPPPAPTATLADPCLRRMLALWSLAQLEDADLPGVRDALRAIAQLPPPESELVAGAIGALPESDQDGRFELVGLAAAAGQAEIANRMVGSLDEAHLIRAATQLHVAGALEILSAEGHRAAYLAAITDDKLATSARMQAITDIVGATDALPADAHAALVTAAASADCPVAARADRALVQRGEASFAPRRPASHNPAALMRGMCVLASYERLQTADEASLLPTYVPARGLERVAVTYDALSDTDADGDGDPHTVHTVDLVKPSEAVLPDLDDLVRAMRHCTGTTCVSNDREFRFTWKPLGPGGQLELARLEIAERPPCQDRVAIPQP